MRLHFELEGDPFCPRPKFCGSDSLPRQCGDRGGLELERHFPCLQSRRVEQVVETQPHLLATGMCDAQVIPLLRSQRSRQSIQKDRDKFASCCEWRLQLVRQGVVKALNLLV